MRGGQRGRIRLLTILDLGDLRDRKSTRLNSSHANISYAVFCLKKKITLLGPHCSLEPLPHPRSNLPVVTYVPKHYHTHFSTPRLPTPPLSPDSLTQFISHLRYT